MLDSRLDLPVLPSVPAACNQGDTGNPFRHQPDTPGNPFRHQPDTGNPLRHQTDNGNPFRHAPFLAGFMASAVLSPQHGRQKAGAVPGIEDVRTQQRHRGHPVLPAPHFIPHLTLSDPMTLTDPMMTLSDPRAAHTPRVFTVPGPHRSLPAPQWMEEAHAMSHRFPAPPYPASAVSGTRNVTGLCHPGQCQDVKRSISQCPGVERGIIRRGSDPAAVAQYLLRAMGSFAPPWPHSWHPPSSDLLKTTASYQGGWGGQRQEWLARVHAVLHAQYCGGPEGVLRDVCMETGARGWREKRDSETAREEGDSWPLAAGTRCGALITTETAHSPLMSSPRALVSSPVTPTGQGCTSATMPTEPESVELNKCCSRSSSDDACLKKLKKGLANRERHCRPKHWKDGANKRRPVLTSPLSQSDQKHNGKCPQQPEDHGGHSDSGEVPEDQRRVFRCPQCRYLTDRKNNLKRHVATMHQQTSRILECCGTVFHSKASLRDHVTRIHRGGYRCQVCARNFCRKALLRRHLAVHSGQKDFACHLCGYATSHKSNLERHQRVHARKTPFTTDHARKTSFTTDHAKKTPFTTDHARKTPFTADHPSFRHLQEESARLTCARPADYDSDCVRDTEASLGQAVLTSYQGFQNRPTARTEECESDCIRDTEASLGQAVLTSYQRSQNMPTAGTYGLKNQANSYFSDDQPRHLTPHNADLQQENDENSCHSGLRNADGGCAAGYYWNTGTTPAADSRTTADPESAQPVEDGERVCRDSTNLPQDTASCCADPVHDHPVGPGSAAAVRAASPCSGAVHGAGGGGLDFKGVFNSESKAYSRRWFLSRKICFPNRLNETYQSTLPKRASEMSTADTSSHPTEGAGSGADDGGGDISVTARLLKEVEVPSDRVQQSLPQQSGDSWKNQKYGCEDKNARGKKGRVEDKRHMCRVLYPCPACSARFRHQRELCSHVCHLQAAGILRFPLTSCIKKGCIIVSTAHS